MSAPIDHLLDHSDAPASRLQYPPANGASSHSTGVRLSPPFRITSETASNTQYDSQVPPEDDSPQNADDLKRARACESCRSLKVRCDQDSADPSAACRRCAKARRECIYTEPSRKRQKKSDSRVAELEKKLDALLQAQQYAQQGLNSGAAAHPSQSQMPPPRHAGSYSSAGRVSDHSSPATPSSAQAPQQQDMQSNKRRRVDGGEEPIRTTYHAPPYHKVENATNAMWKEDEARLKFGVRNQLYGESPEALIAFICDAANPSLHTKVFDRFLRENLPNMPLLSFPPGTTAPEVLEAKPMLFMNIVAASGYGIVSAENMLRVHRKVADVYSDCIIRKGVKSLELVQSILVTTMWFKPPEGEDQMNFYTLIHSAACIALELGLGKRFNKDKARRGFGGPACELPPGRLTAVVDSDSMEARRAWLCCYFCCAAAAISLRRPSLLRWSSYMDECIVELEKNAENNPNDKYFVQVVKIQKLCEDIAISFKMDDPSATAISITDPKVSYTLDIHEQRLRDWRKALPAELASSGKVIFFYDAAVLYLNEIAMHVNHNVEDFKMPFTEAALSSASNFPEALTQRQMSALEACLHSAHRLISTYCGFGFDVIGSLPTLIFFVRCIYALVVLIKMHMAIVAPGSEIGKVIRREDVRVLEHMDMLWNQFQGVAKYATYLPHGKMLKIMGVLREWMLMNVDGPAAKVERQAAAAAALAAANASNGAGAASRDALPFPFGRNLHGLAPAAADGSSKLQVLSEAATAGGRQPTPFHNSNSPVNDQSALANKQMRTALQAQNQTWSFESPGLTFQRRTAGGSVSSDNSNATSALTPQQQQQQQLRNHYQQQGGSGIVGGNGGSVTFGDGFAGVWDPNDTSVNMDFTAGSMDLDQMLDGVFRDLDTSGDLGGFFFGDGVGTYGIPTEGAAPQPGADGKW